MRRPGSVARGRRNPHANRVKPVTLLCTPVGYARLIDTVQFPNVAYSDADIDELLAELNSSLAGHRRPTALISTPNQEVAHLIAGAGMSAVRLACPAEQGDSIELTLVDGAWKRARDHAAH
jgi:hypothetical protein